MTQKDYIMLAGIMKGELDKIIYNHGDDPLMRQTHERIVTGMCQGLQADNSRFKESVFRQACGS